MKNLLRNRLVRLGFNVAIIGGVGYFLGRALSENWSKLEGVDLSPDGWSVLAIICFVLSVVASGLLWGDLLHRLSGMRISAHEATRIHAQSWLLKYIPGQAGSLLNKLAWGSKHGFDRKLVTLSFIYENAFLTLASVLTSVPIVAALFWERLVDNSGSFWPILLVIPLAVLLHQNVFFPLLNLVFKLTKGKPVEREHLLSTSEMASYTVKFIVPRVINAAAFLFVVQSIAPIPAGAHLGLAAIYVLAGIIGLLAILVPSGLGVREGVIVLLATYYFPVEIAVVISLAARLYATIADGALALLYALLSHDGRAGR